MGSTPHFNPPASSVAVHATVTVPVGALETSGEAKTLIQNEEEYSEVRPGPDGGGFHEPFDRRLALERAWNPESRSA